MTTYKEIKQTSGQGKATVAFSNMQACINDIWRAAGILKLLTYKAFRTSDMSSHLGSRQPLTFQSSNLDLYTKDGTLHGN